MKAPRVLITRPMGQHVAFAQRCETIGFDVSLLPCMQILPLDVTTTQLQTLLAQCNSVLFTSANAVRQAHQILPLPWHGHSAHAIGAATAQHLANAGQLVTLTPQSPYNSEAYLEQLKDHLAQSLLVIKGCGGRNLIQPRLEQRGWQIHSLDVYRRVQPQLSSDDIDKTFTSHSPDIVSVTSNEILSNLWTLCQSHAHLLKNIPLIVNSQRCALLAQELGFIEPAMIADPAGDTGQLACLNNWKNTCFTNGQ